MANNVNQVTIDVNKSLDQVQRGLGIIRNGLTECLDGISDLHSIILASRQTVIENEMQKEEKSETTSDSSGLQPQERECSTSLEASQATQGKGNDSPSERKNIISNLLLIICI